MKETKYIILSLVPVAEPKLITAPVPTFLQVQVPVPLVKKLRFRFQFYNTGCGFVSENF